MDDKYSAMSDEEPERKLDPLTGLKSYFHEKRQSKTSLPTKHQTEEEALEMESFEAILMKNLET